MATLDSSETKYIDELAKAITVFAFRGGPIEDMHADKSKHITDVDIKILNKYMVDRIAAVMTLFFDDKADQVNKIIEETKTYWRNWDIVEPKYD